MDFGVVGLGRWGKKVAGEYAALSEEGKIGDVFVFDANAEATKIYNNHDNVKVCNAFDDLLARVDGVHLCVPNQQHYDLAMAAIGKGKSVLVEKPLTMNSEQASKIVSAANDNSVSLQIGHIFRFANVVKVLRKSVESGRFGDLYYISFYWSHLMPYTEGVDVIWDLMPHQVDVYNMLTDRWPENFSGLSGQFRRKALSEAAFIQASTESGPYSTYMVSWVTPLKKRLIEVVGSKSSAKVDAVEQTIATFDNDGNVSSIPVEKNNTIRDEIINFAESAEGKETTLDTSKIGLKTVETLERLHHDVSIR